MNSPLFYSKILLFGEYGIIKNSKGLSIPYNFFKGGLKLGDLSNELIKESNEVLNGFADFLSKIKGSLVEFENKKIKEDLSKGMYFDSTIPTFIHCTFVKCIFPIKLKHIIFSSI